MRDFPLRAWIYTLTVALATAGAVLARVTGGDRVEVVAILAFGCAFLVAELGPVSLSQASYSVSFVVALAAIIVLGPGAAAIVASFGAIDLGLRERPDWLGRMIFNGSQLAASTAAAGATYVALGGPVGQVTIEGAPRMLGAATAAAISYFLVNTSLVASMVTLVRRVPAREVWRANYRAVIVAHLCFSALGILFAILYIETGIGALLFLLVPLVVARVAFQSAARMQDAFDATVRGLVRAIEAKDAFTRGHAERVSRLTQLAAREYGLSPGKARAIRYVALMHDIGKLCVSTTILQKPGKLTPEEYEHMKTHPGFGDTILREIDILRPAIAGVRHHHERLDGRGYPDGLAGRQIPMVARLITVCDAFDSMTSTRSYRPALTFDAAFAELRRCEGTQFDPEVVDALERAILRNGWEAVPEPREHSTELAARAR